MGEVSQADYLLLCWVHESKTNVIEHPPHIPTQCSSSTIYRGRPQSLLPPLKDVTITQPAVFMIESNTLGTNFVHRHVSCH